MEDDVADHDLAALCEAHCRNECETRDVDATMATMVDEPHVNHIPTMTGGVGHDPLKRFYKYHFIGRNPDDTELVPVSRTVGTE
jgi:carboxymethylenebutenolidase